MGGWPTERLLAQASDALNTLDSQAILDRVVQLPVPLMADACVAHRAAGDGWVRMVASAYASPTLESRLSEALCDTLRIDDDTAVARVLRGGPAEACHWTSEPTQAGASLDPMASRFRSLGLGAAMVVPIRGRNGVLGTITLLGYGTKRSYREAHLQVACDLARQVGLPLDNARLFEAEQEARRRAERAAEEASRAMERTNRLQELTAALGSAVTPEQAAQVAAALGRATLSASCATVWLLSTDEAHLDLAACAGETNRGGEPELRLELSRHAPICDALRDGAPLWMPSPTAEEDQSPVASRRRPPGGDGASAAIPLVVGDRTVGGLSLDFPAPRQLTSEDERFMLALAQQCAQAVERTRLFEAERAARARAERLVEQNRHMQLVTSHLSQALPAEEVAQVVCEEGARALGAIRMAVWTLDSATESLSLLGSRGYGSAPDERSTRCGLQAQAPLAEAVRRRAPLWLRCPQKAISSFPATEAPAAAAGDPDGLSCACLPLVAEDRTLGALSAVFPQVGAFGDEERTFLLVLAHHCAQALDRHRLLTDLRDAEEAARAADRRKDQFLALLGHELRNPLAPILTALELMKLRAGHDGGEERAVIERQARHLVRLVDDLLDISRITRGRIELKKKRVEMGAALRQAIEMVSPLLEKHHHQFHVRVSDEELLVIGDEARLVQVFQNLLTNAAKYTPPGGHIQVTAARDNADVVVHVRDDGVGLPTDLLGVIFEPFVQGEQTMDRAEGGMGLGLSLVRSMVQLHGGEVRVTSEGEGRGSEFVVHIPALEGVTGAGGVVSPSSWPPPALAAQRVLVVDDNVDVATMLANLLRCHGHEVTVCHDGPTALAAALAQPPEVALIDISLPVMSGYELARRLRSQLEDRVPTLIAVTGYGQDVDRSRSASAGFADHLVKPVEASTLLTTLARLRATSHHGTPPALTGSP